MSRVERGESRLTAVPSNRRTPDFSSVRVLVVDDDPQAEALISMALTDATFIPVIDVVATAADGIARIQADEHDIYLIDQQLPDGTGIELIRSAHAGATSKPFILMTGFGSSEVDEQASRAGAVDYV